MDLYKLILNEALYLFGLSSPKVISKHLSIRRIVQFEYKCKIIFCKTKKKKQFLQFHFARHAKFELNSSQTQHVSRLIWTLKLSSSVLKFNKMDLTFIGSIHKFILICWNNSASTGLNHVLVSKSIYFFYPNCYSMLYSAIYCFQPSIFVSSFFPCYIMYLCTQWGTKTR